MTSNILSIGQSALAAAQAGIATVGHNIANASTPGYSRQTAIQSAAQPQDFGYGFVGRGTQIETIKRVYSDLLSKQVVSAQSSKNEVDSYYTQIKQIDNLLADSSAGLSPAMQEFFTGVQNLASNPGSGASRQSMLSAGQALAGRFHLLNNRIEEIREETNSSIANSVSVVNAYARQIAQLNESIEKAEGGSNGKPPNDLLDQRDLLISDLSKEIKVSVVKQDAGKYSVFIGNGLPLVVGGQAYALKAMRSPLDATRIEPFFAGNASNVALGADSLAGGNLGGLIEFRARTLDTVQNSLGRVAIGLADSFNAQHRLGQDLNGVPGTDIFAVAEPLVSGSTTNVGNAKVSASISDVKSLTTSNYRLKYDGASYILTRLDDGTTQTFASFPHTVDGFDLNLISGVPSAGDQFLVRPTANGAAAFSLNVSDIAKIAAAAPIRTGAAAANTGTGSISDGAVDASYFGVPLTAPLTISYDSVTNTLSGFPIGLPVSVTSGSGVTTTFPPGVPVTLTAGAEISFGGIRFDITGVPANGDTYTISPNQGGVGDNRNALLLAGLQTRNTLSNGTATYQGAYGELVSLVGNKTKELQVTNAAADKILSEAVQSQQAESGVNLDEEATILLRYQQAYEAAGKVMQIASQMFDVLLDLGQ